MSRYRRSSAQLHKTHRRCLVGLERLESRWLLSADHNDQLTRAGTITPSRAVDVELFAREISTDDDVDIYRIEVAKGNTIDFDLDTVENGVGGLDGYLRLFDQHGVQLAANNDAAAPDETRHGFDAFLRYSFSQKGIYYIGVSNARNIHYDPITGSNDVIGGDAPTGKYMLDVEIAGDYPDVGNTIATAEKFLYPGYEIKGRLSSELDVDFYSFYIADKITVDFNVDTYSRESQGMNANLRLFDAQGNQLAANDEGIGPGDTQASTDPYIRFQFENHYHSGRYFYIAVSHSYRTQYDPNQAVVDVGDDQKFYHLRVVRFGDDTVDTRFTAIPLGEITTEPITLDGSVWIDLDVTLYSLDVLAGQTISFDIDTSLNGVGNLNSYLRLFNTIGKELAFNDNATGPGEMALGFDAYLRYTFQTAGKYYIGVSNNNNIRYETGNGNDDTAGGLHSTGKYTLTIVQSYSNPVDADDAIDEARNYGAVSTWRQPVGVVINEDIDVDMFRFEIPTRGMTVDFVTRELVERPIGMRTYMRLFNSEGLQLASGGIIPARSPAAAYFRYIFPVAGTYYLGVSSSNNKEYDPVIGNGDLRGATDSVGKYSLTIYALQTDFDDEMREATQLDLPAAVSSQKFGSLTEDIDVNLYRFVAMADQVIEFIVETHINSFLRLFSSDGQELAFNDDGPSPLNIYKNPLGSYLRYTFATTGTYYIGVSNAPNGIYNVVDGSGDTAGGTFGKYTLFVRSLTQSYIDTDDSLAEAVHIGAVIAAEKIIEDKIEGPVDVDIISFTVTAGQQVSFDIDTVLGVLSLVRLFNSAGVQLAFNTQTAAPGEIASYYDAYLVYTFATAGTYYLGTSSFFHTAYDPVTGADGPTSTQYSYGRYSLTVRTAVPDPGPVLILTFESNSITEARGMTSGTIIRTSPDISSPLTVSIGTSDNNSVVAPAEIVMPAGNVVIAFLIDAIYDKNRGTRRVTFTIQAPGFQPVSRALLITDSDGMAHNSELPTDANGDGIVTPMDALLVINHLNTTGGDEVPPASLSYFDVSGDGMVTAIDALLVINRLNNPNSGEGEAVVTTAFSTSYSTAVDKILSCEDFPLLSISELRKQQASYQIKASSLGYSGSGLIFRYFET